LANLLHLVALKAAVLRVLPESFVKAKIKGLVIVYCFNIHGDDWAVLDVRQ